MARSIVSRGQPLPALRLYPSTAPILPSVVKAVRTLGRRLGPLEALIGFCSCWALAARGQPKALSTVWAAGVELRAAVGSLPIQGRAVGKAVAALITHPSQAFAVRVIGVRLNSSSTSIPVGRA